MDTDWEKLGFTKASKYKRLRNESLCLSTGIFAIDFALGEMFDGIAGIRQRDVFEVSGPNNSLKTAVAISMMSATLKRFGPESVALLSAEPFNPDRLEQAGINIDDLIIYDCYDHEENGVNASMAEQALEALLIISKDPRIKLIVIDSVAALVPKGVFYDGKNIRDLDSNPVAALAKVCNNFINKFKLLNACSVLLMVNHYREKINTMSYSVISDDNTKLQTTGGRGMEFLSDVRMLCNSTAQMFEDKHSVLDVKMAKGYNSKWTLFKNKYANTTNYRTVKGNLNFLTGKWNNEEFLLDVASFFSFLDQDNPALRDSKNVYTLKKDKGIVYSMTNPVVYKAGASVTIGENSFRGAEKAAAYLRENPEVFAELAKQLFPLHNQFFIDEKPTIDSLLEN